MPKRCSWAKTDLSIAYHDKEWGVPLHDDRKLFEFLILEGAQAGLSWEIILNKREGYRIAFDGFDPYIWQFVDGIPRKRKRGQGVPASTKDSDAMSKDLRAHGFKFVGTTIC